MNYNNQQLITPPDQFYSSNDSQSNKKFPFQNNVFFKGWILTYQDVKTNRPADLSLQNQIENLNLTNIKWTAKFAVVSKFERSMILFDYEPTIDLIVNSFEYLNKIQNQDEETQIDSHNNASTINYRLDNSIKHESFITYWRSRSFKFDLDEKTDDYHQLSIKDLDSLSSSNQNESSLNFPAPVTTNGPFRFAGLFFKKDKSEKAAKHSSLKRAKSGIQLERKKPSLNGTLISNSNGQNPLPSDENNTKQIKSNNFLNKNNQISKDYENRHSLPSPMRPSRSHESLSSPLKPTINLNSTGANEGSHFVRSSTMKSKPSHSNQSKLQTINSAASSDDYSSSSNPQMFDHLIYLNLGNNSNEANLSSVNSIHNSLLNQENCFELKSYSNVVAKLITNNTENNNQHQNLDGYVENLESSQYTSSSKQYATRYFMCRTPEERDKWIQCLRNVSQPNLIDQRHDENSLQVWILEAKGNQLVSKPTKKYFCEISLNNNLTARTCLKDKKDILFWGENFDFNIVNCDYIRVELYQHTIESQKKKSKKDKDYLPNSKEKEQHQSSNQTNSTNLNNISMNQILLGYVNIPVNTIENNNSQPVERWYKLESAASLSSSNDLLNNITANNANMNPVSSSNYLTDSFSQSQNSNNNNNNLPTSASTTQNFSKDSLTIRIKAKYQNVDILPLHFYHRLIEYIRLNYLGLLSKLESHLNVRIKDDLANSVVKIAHKLQIQTKFLVDLVLAEVLQMEDDSLTFRGNSLATKAIESYMKLVGENYLRQTLSDCVRSIIDTNHDLEIDPSKVSNQSSLQSNREELVQILHLVCGRVFNSCTYFPDEIKQVFGLLRHECKMNGKTDEMCDTLISASIFLRFICPAILSPNLFNLTQEYPQEKAARKLTLAAKTLQTIANFSKFGGKEFYMSFEKMNTFVEEHSSLMREFLRNISTLSQEELDNIANASTNKMLPLYMLTPQTPKSLDNSATSLSNTLTNNVESTIMAENSKEINFELELIDLGKQMSILHSLLVAIFNSLDEPTKLKFENEIHDILNELTSVKLNKTKYINMDVIKPKLAVSASSIYPNGINNNNTKLYSYENRLHYALIKNSKGSINNEENSLTLTPSHEFTSPTNTQAFLNEQTLPNSSSSSSSNYSSEITLNILNTNQNKNSNEESSSIRLESEINLLKQKLKETELSLKKEQTEKYLIEFKLKQQQQDNDQQMRNIINRLIKVEEELRKEQSEMHKLLKAKQDLIEIQKKRIEYLSSRSSSSNSLSLSNNQQHTTITNGKILNNVNYQNILASQHANNIINTNNNHNYGLYQPKLRQINKTQIKQQQQQTNTPISITSSISNPSINLKIDNSRSKSPLNSSQYFDTYNSNNNQSPLKASLINKPIAASPSSSSSSMTQFCNYLASNSIINNSSNGNSTGTNIGVSRNLNLNVANSSSNNKTQLNHTKSNGIDQSVTSYPSSSSSTTSTLSNVSAINQNLINSNSNNNTNNNNINQHSSSSSPTIHYLRTSEL